MVERLVDFTEHIALGIELIATMVVAYAVADTLWRLLQRLRDATMHRRKDIWHSFGMWLLLALEFQLAADIVRTAISPSWQQVGELAAIAAIRTFLNFFLEMDLRHTEAERSAEAAAAAVMP